MTWKCWSKNCFSAGPFLSNSCKGKKSIGNDYRGRFFKNFRSVIAQSELRHNSKDDLFTLWEKVVTELWLSYDWPKIFKNRPLENERGFFCRQPSYRKKSKLPTYKTYPRLQKPGYQAVTQKVSNHWLLSTAWLPVTTVSTSERCTD
jgi:hypothetical protein